MLKDAVRNLVPQEILERPKSGMLVPVRYWYRRELKGWARSLLLSRSSRIRTILLRESLRNLLRYRGVGVRSHFGDRIHLLVSLEIWLRVHGVGF